jgi:hypothetical protein
MSRHRPPEPDLRVQARADLGLNQEGVESNSRLTATVGAVLLVLLAVEGVTVLRVGSLLSVHIFVGTLIIPPVLLKVGSTGYRFARYYLGHPAYRRKGPPPALLRILGPLVVLTTLSLLGTGVALIVLPANMHSQLLFLHRASFFAWFAVMTVHVLGHAVETSKLVPRDWVARTRRDVRGANYRLWGVAGALAIGVPLGLLMLSRDGAWLNHMGH